VDLCPIGMDSPSSRDEYFDRENRCLLETVLVMVTTFAREWCTREATKFITKGVCKSPML
jgi:hypothetical protein